MPRDLPLSRRIFFYSMLVGFVIFSMEVIAQVFYYATAGDFLYVRTAMPLLEADPHRCYRLRANLELPVHTNEFEITVYTNSQSMRTDARRQDVAYEKPADVYRILFLGPSFAYGWGSEYEEAYP